MKADVTGRKNDLHVTSGPRLCPEVTTTATSPPPATCGHYLWLGGWGPANNAIGYAVGYFKYDKTMSDGRKAYKQIQGGHVLQYRSGKWVVSLGDDGDILAYNE